MGLLWEYECCVSIVYQRFILTVREYLRLGREIGYRAAHNQRGTYVKIRNDNTILVYWEAGAGQRGMFMAVRVPNSTAGEIATLFSPDEGKRYFDFQEPIMATFH